MYCAVQCHHQGTRAPEFGPRHPKIEVQLNSNVCATPKLAWPIEAAAIGSGSTSSYTSSKGTPSSNSTTENASLLLNAGTRSCTQFGDTKYGTTHELKKSHHHVIINESHGTFE